MPWAPRRRPRQPGLEPAEQVAEAGDLEPRPGACGRALEAAAESAPASELGEGVLDLVERRDRREARVAGRRGLDHQAGAVLRRGLAERPVAAVPKDVGDPWLRGRDSRYSSRATVGSAIPTPPTDDLSRVLHAAGRTSDRRVGRKSAAARNSSDVARRSCVVSCGHHPALVHLYQRDPVRDGSRASNQTSLLETYRSG